MWHARAAVVQPGTMRLIFASLAVAGLVSLVGCDGCSTEPPPPGASCTLPDGTPLGVGQSGSAGDECNTCLCTLSGELSCTEIACNDAGPAGEGEGEGEEPVDAGVDEGPCEDADGDGFYDCIDPEHPERPTVEDCDDQRFHVQPGGIEFPDTPEDDNCNDSNTDFANCDCAALSADNARDLAAAMDLCGDVIAGATKAGASEQFGIVDAYQDVVEERLRVRVDGQGSEPVVIGNSCLASLSSGSATGTGISDGPNVCTFNDPDPAGAGDDTICDLAQLRLTLRAPPNAQGFAFDFMFLSYEWPEYLCDQFNDTFYAIVETDAVFGGEPTNAAFDTAGRPITVNVGFFENPASWTVPLDGISHADDSLGGCSSSAFNPVPGCVVPDYCDDGTLDVRSGSGSGWLTTTVPITPGQQDVQLVLSIHDEADNALDSLVILDSFRWLNLPTELETAKEED
jgi:hypothetical protein